MPQPSGLPVLYRKNIKQIQNYVGEILNGIISLKVKTNKTNVSHWSVELVVLVVYRHLSYPDDPRRLGHF